MMKRKGYCSRCGACCNVNNFPPTLQVNTEIPFDEEGWCAHIDEDRRLCTIYEDRPRICGEYPRGPSEIASLPQCTYYFIS